MKNIVKSILVILLLSVGTFVAAKSLSKPSSAYFDDSKTVSADYKTSLIQISLQGPNGQAVVPFNQTMTVAFGYPTDIVVKNNGTDPIYIYASINNTGTSSALWNALLLQLNEDGFNASIGDLVKNTNPGNLGLYLIPGPGGSPLVIQPGAVSPVLHFNIDLPETEANQDALQGLPLSDTINLTAGPADPNQLLPGSN